jgi:mannose-6-phosphate isomerase-like protein (cupin superfamily)
MTDAGESAPSFVIREWDLAPSEQFMSLPHIHHSAEEAFCVIEGRLAVVFDDEVRYFGAGEVAMIERGTRHTFRAEGPHGARVLAVLTPEVDRLIEELHRPGATPEEIAAMWRAADSELV